MSRRRKAFIVYVDLDDIPGTMHTEESAQAVIRNVLYQRMSGYDPQVAFAPDSLQPDAEDNAPRTKVDLGKISFGFKMNAYLVLDSLRDLISINGFGTVADLYRLANASSQFVDNHWGWTDGAEFDIKENILGYYPALPDPKLLTNTEGPIKA